MVGCTGVGENPSPPSVRPESTHLWYHKTNYSSLQSLGGSVANNQSVGYLVCAVTGPSASYGEEQS